MRMLIDTGASRSFIRESALTKCRLYKWHRKNNTFLFADGTTSFSTSGEIQLNIQINNIITTVTALVVNNLSCECILGMVFVNTVCVVNWIQYIMVHIELLIVYLQIHMWCKMTKINVNIKFTFVTCIQYLNVYIHVRSISSLFYNNTTTTFDRQCFFEISLVATMIYPV